jgi:hypothetical protein
MGIFQLKLALTEEQWSTTNLMAIQPSFMKFLAVKGGIELIHDRWLMINIYIYTMQVGSSLSRPRIGRTPTAKGLWMKWPFHSDLIWPSALFFEPSRSARRPSDVADWICDNKLHTIYIYICGELSWSMLGIAMGRNQGIPGLSGIANLGFNPPKRVNLSWKPNSAWGY